MQEKLITLLMLEISARLTWQYNAHIQEELPHSNCCRSAFNKRALLQKPVYQLWSNTASPENEAKHDFLRHVMVKCTSIIKSYCLSYESDWILLFSRANHFSQLLIFVSHFKGRNYSGESQGTPLVKGGMHVRWISSLASHSWEIRFTISNIFINLSCSQSLKDVQELNKIHPLASVFYLLCEHRQKQYSYTRGVRPWVLL